MKTKYLFFLAFLLAAINQSRSQTTIEQCYAGARQNYPMIHQYDLIEKTKDYNLKNASSAWLPQLGLSAKATYQTDVTTIPIPGSTEMPKDQYQVALELNQTIWDGGITKSQKRNINLSAEVDSKRVDVELYALNERVNNLYFGALLLEKQLVINNLLDEELNRNLGKVEDYVKYGIANQADVDAVRVEILTNTQRKGAIEASLWSYYRMLSEIVGFCVTKLIEPDMPIIEHDNIKRPELELFDKQKESIDAQKKTLNSISMPKIGLFAQGAYGNPGLNMIKPGFTPYAIGGVRLSWNISSLYTRKNDIGKIESQKAMIDNQKEAFLYNTNLQVTQILGEIKRLQSQIAHDDEIIKLRRNIKLSAEAKVEGGTLTVTDMLREVTAENTAMLTKAIHQTELLKAFYDNDQKTNYKGL